MADHANHTRCGCPHGYPCGAITTATVVAKMVFTTPAYRVSVDEAKVEVLQLGDRDIIVSTQQWLCLECGKIGNLPYCPHHGGEFDIMRVQARPLEIAAHILGGRDAVLALLLGEPQ